MDPQPLKRGWAVTAAAGRATGGSGACGSARGEHGRVYLAADVVAALGGALPGGEAAGGAEVEAHPAHPVRVGLQAGVGGVEALLAGLLQPTVDPGQAVVVGERVPHDG